MAARTRQRGPSARESTVIVLVLICVATVVVLLRGAFDPHPILVGVSLNKTDSHHSGNSHHKRTAEAKRVCAQHDGFIIANMNGRLANNLFQIAMANRLSGALCWPVIFKEGWQGVFPNEPRATQCFPQALQFQRQHNSNSNNNTVTKEDRVWFDEMKIDQATDHFWSSDDFDKFYTGIQFRQTHDLYEKWSKESEEEGTSLRIASRWEYTYTDRWDTELVEHLQHPGDATFTTHLVHDDPNVRRYYDTVRTIHLDAFFIDYHWMHPYMNPYQILQWLQINVTECCHHLPPDNAVVLHVRNFQEWEHLNPRYKTGVFTDLLDHFYFQRRGNRQNDKLSYILWIVCPPDDVNIALVQALNDKYNATIMTGNDPYDAFCTLQHARELILSTHSTFSQMAALLSSPKTTNNVHYVLPTLQHPEVTLVVPHWQYHLVGSQNDSIQTYNVDPSLIQSIMS